eukprot:8913851-Pyramimonas_sp.AAC.2
MDSQAIVRYFSSCTKVTRPSPYTSRAADVMEQRVLEVEWHHWGFHKGDEDYRTSENDAISGQNDWLADGWSETLKEAFRTTRADEEELQT